MILTILSYYTHAESTHASQNHAPTHILYHALTLTLTTCFVTFFYFYFSSPSMQLEDLYRGLESLVAFTYDGTYGGHADDPLAVGGYRNNGTDPFTHLCIHSPTHPLTHSPTHPLIHSLIHKIR